MIILFDCNLLIYYLNSSKEQYLAVKLIHNEDRFNHNQLIFFNLIKFGCYIKF